MTKSFADIKNLNPQKVGLGSLPTFGTAASKDVGTGANQIPDMSYFAASLERNGWEKLPSGKIRQWGYVTLSGYEGPPETFNLPIPFPNEALNAHATVQYANNVSGIMNVYVAAITNSTITLVPDSATSQIKPSVYYEVEGK
ncbi:hypothetical protein [Kluyvera ascorbata]|uniref:gp53-like domain-containing protein n=1 Tax=Kluyvera ascorbata TaxID=51288 RepID=UPI0028FF9877|nr:hypothetical protein [Kluyvera ascorbata]MDU1195365.1 hypothetical protein [Kluyvera ascorbata]